MKRFEDRLVVRIQNANGKLRSKGKPIIRTRRNLSINDSLRLLDQARGEGVWINTQEVFRHHVESLNLKDESGEPIDYVIKELRTLEAYAKKDKLVNVRVVIDGNRLVVIGRKSKA